MSTAVVIGAGVGGLSVAARLAAAGLDVTVLEQSDQVGGKLAGYERDGFVFDTGPSLLTLPAVYRDTFLKTGRPIERQLELMPVDPAMHYRFPDGSVLDVPNANRGALARTLSQTMGAQASEQWLGLLDRGGRVWELTRDDFLGAPVDSTRSVLRLARSWSDVRTIAPFTSLRGLGQRTLDDPRLRLLLDRYATYSGSDPRRAPAALASIPYVEQTFGAWHVRGGVHRLAAALHGRLVDLGVTIRLGTAVTGLIVRDGRAVGVSCADGTSVAADVVVSDADAYHLYRDLVPEGAATGERRRVSKADRSLAGFVMLLALDDPGYQPSHHTVLFGADYDAEFDAIFGRGRPASPPSDPTVYVCAPNDDTMAPAGAQAWSVLVNVPRHGPESDPGCVDWRAPGLATRYAEHILSVLAARGLDVRDRIRWQEIRTPADLAEQTFTPGGAIYGAASHGPTSAFRRPANRSPLPGLYLVGGSAHPGGGLPLVAMSAETTTTLITASPL